MLRSMIPDHSYAELEWLLVGLWMIQLFAVQGKVCIGEPSVRIRAVLVIRGVRAILFLRSEVPESGADLTTQLQQAAVDTYQRRSSKRVRY